MEKEKKRGDFKIPEKVIERSKPNLSLMVFSQDGETILRRFTYSRAE
jgi:hypothetical protein